jgi:hypothetical protein
VGPGRGGGGAARDAEIRTKAPRPRKGTVADLQRCRVGEGSERPSSWSTSGQCGCPFSADQSGNRLDPGRWKARVQVPLAHRKFSHVAAALELLVTRRRHGLDMTSIRRQCRNRWLPSSAALNAATVAWLMVPGAEEVPTSLEESLHRPEWQEHAACRGQPIELLFPRRGDSIAAANAACGGCPVPTGCLDFALSVDGGHALQSTSRRGTVP